MSPFIILCIQTVILWMFVVLLYSLKNRITLIPLFSYIAVMTLSTHNISDLGYSVTFGNFVFFIASFSFFTTLMFGTLYLYLFEGPRAGRQALWVILGSSFLYIWLVFMMGLLVDTTSWVKIDLKHLQIYFWSISAILIDIIVLAVGWELLAKIKVLFLDIRVFIVTFAVLALDTIIFTSGVFGSSDVFWPMLQANLLSRLALSIVAAPIIASSLRFEGFSESFRKKPKNFWEILNFRSDLEQKIVSLEDDLLRQKSLQEKLVSAEEKIEMALSAVKSGVWDWDLKNKKIDWSEKCANILGYSATEMPSNVDEFKKIIHDEDVDPAFDRADLCIKDKSPYEVELRIKNKSGEYIWCQANGITKYDSNGSAIKMTGMLININESKKSKDALEKNLAELTKLNEVMVGREVRMAEMKKELDSLREAKG